MKRFITGNRFKELANYTFSPPVKRGDDYYNLPNTYDPEKVKDDDIIYTDAGYVQDLLMEVSILDKKVILITHNGDTNIDFIPPDNVIKWYTTNVNVIHPQIESIPIGLENDLWFPEVHKKEKMLLKMNEPKVYRNLMYMNHSIATNPAIRERLYQMFEGKSWVTSSRGSNRANLFDEYLDNIFNHKFVLCPEGNGMDTHRTWETLYMGSIPIEKRNLNNRFYEDLPICFVNDWEEITEEFLINKYRILRQQWNLQMLNFEYWKNKIQNESLLHTSRVSD
jgi:Exostosin family.